MKKSILSIISLVTIVASTASLAVVQPHSKKPVKPLVEINSVAKLINTARTFDTISQAEGADITLPNPIMKIRSIAKIKGDNKPLLTFDSIRCEGDVDIKLIPSPSANNSVIHITRDSRQKVKLSVKDNVLSIHESELSYKGRQPVQLIIPVHQLKKLSVQGHVSVYGKGLNTQGLDLYANTVGVVTLAGKINLNSVSAANIAQVNLQWVDSQHLIVNTYDNSHVTLAGIAQHVLIKSAQHSQFDGQYLRVSHALADVKEYAKIKLLPIDSLRAFANGYGKIYYYKKPKQMTKLGKESGNIMQVQWRR